MKRSLTSLTLALLLGIIQPCSAADILDSMTGRTIQQVSISTVSASVWQGFSFEVGASGYNLNTVQFIPALFSSSGTGNINIALYTLGATSLFPNTNQLPTVNETVSNITFANSSSMSSANVYSFNPSTTWTLSPNTRYSLIFRQSSLASSGIARITTNTPPTAGSGITYLGIALTTDASSWNTSSDNPFYVTISDTVVPEPSTYLLGLLAAGTLAAIRHRRKFA